MALAMCSLLGVVPITCLFISYMGKGAEHSDHQVEIGNIEFWLIIKFVKYQILKINGYFDKNSPQLEQK